MDSPSTSKLDSHRVQLPFISSRRYLTFASHYHLTSAHEPRSFAKVPLQYPIRFQSAIAIGPMLQKYFCCVLFVISCKRDPLLRSGQVFPMWRPHTSDIFFSITRYVFYFYFFSRSGHATGHLGQSRIVP